MKKYLSLLLLLLLLGCAGKNAAPTAETAPTSAGKRFARSRHWSVRITRKSAVIAKSIPFAANGRAAPATAPATTPKIQYAWSNAARSRQ